MRSKLLIVTLGFTLTLAASAQSWDVTKTIHIGGEGAWDYLTVDAQAHRLYVPRTTHTQVIDEDSGKVLGDIPGQKGAHGVAVVPALNRGFITDGGGPGGIVVFDLKSFAILGTLKTMPDSDGIIYDEQQNLVLAVSGDGNSLMTFAPDIDPVNGKVDVIALGGAPEFLAADGAGKVYINLEDKNLVAVVDLKVKKVVNRWPVAPGGKPVGMALDESTHSLVVGCRAPQLMVFINTADGKVTGTLPIGAGVDATKVAHGQAFASAGDGTLTIAAAKNGRYEVVQTVKTPAGARTMGIDAVSHRIFMPTAELQPATTGRPKPKPDTFMIVVVGAK